MKYIAHRGLIDGPNIFMENKPEQIINTLSKGYDCEVDVWRVKNAWFLGHNYPQYEVDNSFIGKQGLWLHCKNLDALHNLCDAPFTYVYFWHQEDEFTLTSNGHIWTYPGRNLTNNSVAVQPEFNEDYWKYTKDCRNIIGVCTKYVTRFINETSTVPVRTTPQL